MLDLQTQNIKLNMQQINDQMHLVFCKNHPEVVSRYFVTEQPWVRYCKECALNVALCGRTISQDFSGDQFQRKMQIVSVVNQLRRNSQLSQENNSCYEKIIGMLEDGAKPLSEHICQIDKSIRELTNVRDKLSGMLEKEIVSRVNCFLERQSKMALTNRQVKSQLEAIESNFSGLIGLESKQSFESKMMEWGQLIQTSKRQQITEEQYNQNRQGIYSIVQTFYSQLQKLSQFSINIDLKKQWMANSDTFEMILTPMDSNAISLSASMSMQGSLKKMKRELKLRSNKKGSHNNTDRDMTTRKQSKRGSVSRIQSHYLSDICRVAK